MRPLYRHRAEREATESGDEGGDDSVSSPACLDELECMALNAARILSLREESGNDLKYADIQQRVTTLHNDGTLKTDEGRYVSNCCFFIAVADGMGDRTLAPWLLEESGYTDWGYPVNPTNRDHWEALFRVGELSGANILIYMGQTLKGRTRGSRGKVQWVIGPEPREAIPARYEANYLGATPSTPPVIRIVTNDYHFECIVDPSADWDPLTLGEEFVYTPDQTESDIVRGSQVHAWRKLAREAVVAPPRPLQTAPAPRAVDATPQPRRSARLLERHVQGRRIIPPRTTVPYERYSAPTVIPTRLVRSASDTVGKHMW